MSILFQNLDMNTIEIALEKKKLQAQTNYHVNFDVIHFISRLFLKLPPLSTASRIELPQRTDRLTAD